MAWSESLLDATGLTESQMPSLIEGTEQGGTLKADLAAKWGMGSGVVVAGGAGDNAASACGMGTVGEGHAFVSLGTSGVLFAANASYLPNPASAVHAFCHALPNTWHQMGVILSATDALNWHSEITGKSAADLTAELGDNLNAPSGVSFLPYLSASARLTMTHPSVASLPGLPMRAAGWFWTQAVLEGVSFALRDSLEALRVAGTTLSRVTAIGGGSRSRYWLKSIATALNLPVDVPADGDFGAAFGAARLGLVAATKADPLSVFTAPETAETIQPEASLHGAYEDAYQRYRRLYPAIKSAMF